MLCRGETSLAPVGWLSDTIGEGFARSTRVPPQYVTAFMNTTPNHLQLWISPLRPDCRASEQVLHWKGPNIESTPATIDNPLIRLLAQVVSCASLSDNTSYRPVSVNFMPSVMHSAFPRKTFYQCHSRSSITLRFGRLLP